VQRAESLPWREVKDVGKRARLPVDLPSIGFLAALVAGLAVIYMLSLSLYRPTQPDARAGVDAYNLVGGILVAALIIPISLPLLKRQSLREGDRRVLTLLVFALLLKVAGAIIRHYVVFDLYGGGDAAGYHGRGFHLMEGFRAGDFDPGLESYTDTDFIRLLTGIIYTVIGPTSYGGFLIYSWLAFWGLFLLYRAFVIAVPDGRNLNYGVLLFFFPSIVFWPSSLGKEAWMLFTIGIFAFGAARVLSGRMMRGLPIAALGLWLGTLIRPHVPGMLGGALIVALLVGRRYEKFRPTKPIVRIATLAVLVAGSLLLLTRLEGFLRSDITSLEGFTSTLESTAERSDHGGSEFEPTIVRSPLDLPPAFVTVLYRPFLFEANNALAMLSAVEGAFLLLFTIWRIPWVLAAIKKMRRQPYITLAICYTLLFVVAFSSMPNFGLLARQRVQLLPFFFVLLCVPPAKKAAAETHEAAVERPTWLTGTPR
jgi:hypothetical protein